MYYMAIYFILRLAYKAGKSLGWDKLVLVPLCWHVCNFFISFLSSQRRGQLVKFSEVTQVCMVACNVFTAIALLKYG